jgi:hypothetical protein
MIAIGFSHSRADYGPLLSSSSIVIFREIDTSNGVKDAVIVQPSSELLSKFQRATMVPVSAMETTSLSRNGRPPVPVGKFSSLES